MKNLGVVWKQVIILLLGALGVIAVVVFSLYTLRDSLLAERRTMASQQVDLGHRVLKRFHGFEVSGDLTREEAKTGAAETLRELGIGKTEYFWIVDGQSYLVMHPHLPQFEQIPFDDIEYPVLTVAISAILDKVNRSGDGFVAYTFDKPGTDEVEQKFSYVVQFAPWDWILGAGVYIDDVQASFLRIAWITGGVSVAVLALVLIASVLLSRSVTTPLTQVASGLRRLSEGDSAVEIPRIHRRDELGDLVHAMGAFHDSLQDRQRLIRELENQNEILAESEARFRDLAELLPETIFEVDDKGRITYANRAAFSAFGRPESDVDKGISLFDLFSKRDHPRVIRNVGRVMKGEVLGANEYLACRADGTTFSVLIRSVAVLRDGRPVGLRGIMFDISERIAAEQRELGLRAEIAHVSRLSTMGEMAAGFAHELNQPLAAIRNYARGCLRRLEGGETDAAAFEMAMEKISEESSRAGEIIRRIRDFIHKRKPENVLFDMEHLIRDVVEIQASEMRHASVDIEVSIEKDLPEVLGDPITVRQVLLNLVRNAAEVLANWSGSKRHILVSASRSMDQWIKVAVADSGPGIPEDLLSKIFEPFFSTKDNGTGMGLSICRTIVESHGGRLEVETPAEGGTRFWFRLPVEAR